MGRQNHSAKVLSRRTLIGLIGSLPMMPGSASATDADDACANLHQLGKHAQKNARKNLDDKEDGVFATDIEIRVRKIIVEHLGVEETKVRKSSNLVHDLGADSLDTVEVAMAIEEEFQIEIPQAAADEIVTVGDLIQFVTKNVR